jgi:uncharacterized protein YjbK
MSTREENHELEDDEEGFQGTLQNNHFSSDQDQFKTKESASPLRRRGFTNNPEL